MKYEKLVFTDIEFNVDSIDLQIEASDELIEAANSIREKLGYDDLVGTGYNNDVYYNFYLVSYPNKKEIKLLAICNHGEKDDYKDYELPLQASEKESLAFQVIEKLMKTYLSM